MKVTKRERHHEAWLVTKKDIADAEYGFSPLYDWAMKQEIYDIDWFNDHVYVYVEQGRNHLTASIGDYIVVTPKGKVKVMGPEAFTKRFEEV